MLDDLLGGWAPVPGMSKPLFLAVPLEGTVPHVIPFSSPLRIGLLATVATLLVAAGPSSSQSPLAEPAASGLIEIGGEAHTFEVRNCAFGPEETGNPQVEFALQGENELTELTVDVSRVDMSEAGIGNQDVVLFLVGDPRDPEEALEATWEGDTAGEEGASEFLTIREDRIRGENLTFVGIAGPNAGEEVTGSIRATCP